MPFLAEFEGRTVVVLQFVVAFYGVLYAVLCDPDGGRVWMEEARELRNVRPTTQWPIAPREYEVVK